MNEGLILIHHGVKGQKWGVRRFQNNTSTSHPQKKTLSDEERKARRKTALKIGIAAAGTALAIYGGYKVGKYIQYERAISKAIEAGKQATNINKNKTFFENANKAYKSAINSQKKLSGLDNAINQMQKNIGKSQDAIRKESERVAKSNAEYVKKQAAQKGWERTAEGLAWKENMQRRYMQNERDKRVREMTYRSSMGYNNIPINKR